MTLKVVFLTYNFVRSMKLSVLIPVYNGENYIAGCLDGVLRQNMNPNDYEVIVMDDGSTDNTYLKAKELEKVHGQIKVFTQNHKGLFNTRNTLLGMAKGEYVYNLDVDDYLVSNRIHHILEFAFEKNLDFVGFKSNELKNLAKRDLTQQDLAVSRVYRDGEQFILSNPNHRIEVWWYIVRRSFLNEQGLFFEDNQNNADVLFTYKLLLNVRKIGYFDWLTHYYYQSPDSIMRSDNFEKNIKLVNTMHAMMLSNGNLLQRVYTKGNKEVYKVIKRRMQKIAFGNLIKMVKMGMDYEFIQSKCKDLRALGIYPFNTKGLFPSNNKSKLFAILANRSFFILLGTQLIKLQKGFRGNSTR